MTRRLLNLLTLLSLLLCVAAVALWVRSHRVGELLMHDAFKAIENVAFGAAIRNVASVEVLKALRIALPPLAAQREIVAEIEAEQRLVEGNRQLIERMEQKIVAAIARIWGEDAKASDAPAADEATEAAQPVSA
jgi:hypothetical protein